MHPRARWSRGVNRTSVRDCRFCRVTGQEREVCTWVCVLYKVQIYQNRRRARAPPSPPGYIFKVLLYICIYSGGHTVKLYCIPILTALRINRGTTHVCGLRRNVGPIEPETRKRNQGSRSVRSLSRLRASAFAHRGGARSQGHRAPRATHLSHVACLTAPPLPPRPRACDNDSHGGAV